MRLDYTRQNEIRLDQTRENEIRLDQIDEMRKGWSDEIDVVR